MAFPTFNFLNSTLAAATAKRIDTGLPNRTQVWIFNADAAAIFIGKDNTVTNANGFSIAAGATFGPLNVGFDPSSGTPQVWAYSVAGSAANAVRVLENGGPL